jgi:hypothetical protein
VDVVLMGFIFYNYHPLGIQIAFLIGMPIFIAIRYFQTRKDK